MKVKIKFLNENAKMPSKSHDDDFCYDVVATSVEIVAPGVYRYGTGISIEPINEKDNRIIGITARPRSSVWKTGMVLSNSMGTIDYGYRGEIMAVFYHLFPDMPRYEIGDKIFQIHVDSTIPIEFEEVSDLSDTTRGDGGFGSTGK